MVIIDDNSLMGADQASADRGGQISIEEEKQHEDPIMAQHLGSTRQMAYAVDSSLPDFTLRIN